MDSVDAARDFVGRVASWRAAQTSGYVVVRGPERVPHVSELKQDLLKLGIKELNYFEEGLDCIQYAQAPRAAIVLGWTGFIDLLESRLERNTFSELNAILNTDFHGIYKKLGHVKSRKELVEHFDDKMLLEAGRKLKFYQSKVWSQLNAMRDERNNCAHVEEYAVTVPIAMGYYAHLIQYLPLIL
jgi:hypothetical protein